MKQLADLVIYSVSALICYIDYFSKILKEKEQELQEPMIHLTKLFRGQDKLTVKRFVHS